MRTVRLRTLWLLAIGYGIFISAGCEKIAGPTPPPAGPIEILQPIGGETYRVGDVVRIMWKINDLAKVSSVGIRFDSTGMFLSNKVFEELLENGSLPPDTTWFDWTVKSSEVSKRCKIQVREYNNNCDPGTSGFFTVTK